MDHQQREMRHLYLRTDLEFHLQTKSMYYYKIFIQGKHKKMNYFGLTAYPKLLRKLNSIEIPSDD